jgi:predicted SAM-dependent methyltransferase
MTSETHGIRLNVGCGPSGIPGWVNLDNSLSVRLARIPGAMKALALVGLVGPPSLGYFEAVREFDIQYGSAQHLPFRANSVEVLYSSHMLEHLDRDEARRFLAEALRVLAPSGIIRLAVPDLQMRAKAYLESGDADAFVASLHMREDAPRTYRGKLKFLVLGNRGHQWMYDAASLSALLESCGFLNARSMNAGETSIPDPGKLDLRQRIGESVYVEASKPVRSNG